MVELTVEKITKTFGGVAAVDGVSLGTGGRGITALIGPNGAGKTTLFNVITAFERPDSGRVVFDGVALTAQPPWKVARRGMVRTFQTPVGFPTMTVSENLLVAGADTRSEGILRALVGRRAWGADLGDCARRAERVLEDLGLLDLRDAHVMDLAAGDAKLVEFARQLMRRPKMLLLDEPASGVDPSHLGRLGDVIRSVVTQDIAVMLIDHNLGFVLDIADYVYVMAEGRLLSEGAPDAVARDPKVLETYVGKAAA